MIGHQAGPCALAAGNMSVNPMGGQWMQQPYVQQGQHFVPMMPPGMPLDDSAHGSVGHPDLRSHQEMQCEESRTSCVVRRQPSHRCAVGCRPWIPPARAVDTVPSQRQAWVWGTGRSHAPGPDVPSHALHAARQHHLRACARHAWQPGHAEQPWRAPASHVPPGHDATGTPRRAHDASHGGSRRSRDPPRWPHRCDSTQLARAAQQGQRPTQLPGAAPHRMSAAAPARLSSVASVRLGT